VQLQSGVNDGNLDVTSRNSAGMQSTTISGTLTAVDTDKGAITVKVTGSQVIVIVYKARIEIAATATGHTNYPTSNTTWGTISESRI